jgi:DNA polymerase-1
VKLLWKHITIRTNLEAQACMELWDHTGPEIGAFDSETTGLHIILDKPFLFQFGWIHPGMQEGYTFAVDMERQPQLAAQVIRAWRRRAYRLKKNLAHNVKFDIHMLRNAGFEYTEENLSDSQFFIRLAHDAITQKHGGPPLKLKQHAMAFIDPSAKAFEAKLDTEKTAISKTLNMKLKARLGAGWTMKRLDEFFDDALREPADLSPTDYEAYTTWLNEDVPEQMRRRIRGRAESEDVPYNLLDRDTVIEYAHYDIVWVLELYLGANPVLLSRHNEEALRIEESCIHPFLEMERVGFRTDREYLESSRKEMKSYILQQRAELLEIAGRKFTLGQHEVIKEILRTHFDLDVKTSTEEELTRLSNSLRREQPGHGAIRFIALIQELRTLEKWYSTYILRFQKELHTTDRLYTTIHQVGTVSGRVSSDFQQFPKKGITKEDGTPLFHPRNMVISTDGEWEGIVYLDYSQIELRLQAMYTLLVGHPDMNLCRAYMPFDCVDSLGNLFIPTNPEHIANWQGEWFLREDPTQRWLPIDVHADTTCYAFNVTPDDPKFKELRGHGKTLNFAKNYGAGRGRVRDMFPEATEEEVTRINDAYYKAFPGVKFYQDYCYRLAQSQAYATNLFGVKYYGVSGHNLINMLIQGSGAYLLKITIRRVYDYCKVHGIKSRLQMNIHDELSWEKHVDDDPQVFFELKQIMESWPDFYVPIVAEMEFTRTSWAKKSKVEGVESFAEGA